MAHLYHLKGMREELARVHLLLIHNIYPAFVSLQLYPFAHRPITYVNIVVPEDEARLAAKNRCLGARVKNGRFGGEVKDDECSHFVAERAGECEQLQVVREKQYKVTVNL